MNAYERLMAEAIPTGTFGHAQPPPTGPRPWTALEQAEHYAVLEAALADWHWNDDPRHLRVVREADAA